MRTHEAPMGRIDLYWIPLGAGGSGFVRLNGRIYEAIEGRLEHRRPLALYHTALQVHVPEGRFVVETMWPSPDADTASRGVVSKEPWAVVSSPDGAPSATKSVAGATVCSPMPTRPWAAPAE